MAIQKEETSTGYIFPLNHRGLTPTQVELLEQHFEALKGYEVTFIPARRDDLLVDLSVGSPSKSRARRTATLLDNILSL